MTATCGYKSPFNRSAVHVVGIFCTLYVVYMQSSRIHVGIHPVTNQRASIDRNTFATDTDHVRDISNSYCVNRCIFYLVGTFVHHVR